MDVMAINFKRHPLNTFQAFPIAMYKRLQKYRLVSYLVSLRKIAKSLNYLYLGRFSKGRLNFLRGERDMCLLGRGGAPLVHPGRDDHRNQQTVSSAVRRRICPSLRERLGSSRFVMQWIGFGDYCGVIHGYHWLSIYDYLCHDSTAKYIYI